MEHIGIYLDILLCFIIFFGGLLYFHQSIPGCFHPRPGLNGPQARFFRKGCQVSAARSNSKSVEHSLLGNFDAEVLFSWRTISLTG